MSANQPQEKEYQITESNHVSTNLLFKEINCIKSEMTKVKQKLNNGVLESTNENTKAIKNLSNQIRELEKTVNKKENYKEGKTDTWKIIIAVITSVGGGALGMFKVLSLLGMIGG